jgi:hypothetical protein
MGVLPTKYLISKEATATMHFFTYTTPCNRVHPFRNNLRGAEVQLELVEPWFQWIDVGFSCAGHWDVVIEDN